MYIKIDKTGKILSIEKKSWINIDWLSEKRQIDSIISGEAFLEQVQFCITDNKFNYAAIPAYYRGEFYYCTCDDGSIYLSDDLFDIAKRVSRLSVIPEMKSYFLKKGYLSVGRTLFKEIKRLHSNSLYVFNNGDIICRNIKFKDQSYSSDKEQYLAFKNKVNYAVTKHIANNNAILLSGGGDSRLLLVLLKKYTDNITVITNSAIPYFTGNCVDVLIAEKISKLLSLDIEISSINYADIDIGDLDNIIRRMPLSVHFGLNFSQMCRTAAKINKNMTVFCGQNMDTLYNLGPTERTRLDFHGIAQWFKRFYLSEEYFKTLPDVSQHGKLTDRLTAQIGLQLFRLITHQKNLRLPQNTESLINNFANSNDYTVFSDSRATPQKLNVRSPFDVKKELYKLKLSYLKGGDSQAVETGGYLNNLKIVLPYSEQDMVEYFYNLHLTKQDVWKPKRYVYAYLNEFIPKYGSEIASFKRPSASELKKRFGDVIGLYKAFEHILHSTKFGQNLVKAAHMEVSGYSGLQKFSSALCAYWFNRVISLLENEYNVQIS